MRAGTREVNTYVSVYLRLILGYQKCGSFSTIVKSEATVDVSGMIILPQAECILWSIPLGCMNYHTA